MLTFRKFAILLINIIVIAWLTHTFFFSEGPNDFMYMFVLGGGAFLFLFYIYSFVLYNLFPKNLNRNYFLEAVFLVLLLLPFLVIWYLSHTSR